MNLLLATDHRFLTYESRVYDTSTYDGGFFRDYREAFERISVICRMKAVKSLPRHAFNCSDNDIRFIPVPDVHGVLWALMGDRLAGPVAGTAVRETDALVVRVPGQVGSATASFARRYGKPYMVEVVGDPHEAITNLGKTLFHRLIALRYAQQLRILAMHASSGSYVTSVNLPKAYPVREEVPFQCISDIRLTPEHVVEPKDYRNRGSTLRIVMVANLVPYKRHQDLLLATTKLTDRGEKVELRFAGEGPCRRRLQKLTRRLGLNSHVRFLGHISDRRALVDLLDASDLFVLTSGTEGLPRAMIEAMARGLPVIASRAGGTTELVNDTELFPVGDIKRLASLIGSLCSDSERLNRLSAASVEKARAFTSDKLSSKRIALYRFLRDRVVRAGK